MSVRIVQQCLPQRFGRDISRIIINLLERSSSLDWLSTITRLLAYQNPGNKYIISPKMLTKIKKEYKTLADLKKKVAIMSEKQYELEERLRKTKRERELTEKETNTLESEIVERIKLQKI
jgi:hypothetical protein